MNQNTISSGEMQVISPTLRTSCVTVGKSGNLIDVSDSGDKPLPADVRRLLEPLLTYEKKNFLFGRDRYDPLTGDMSRRVELITKCCYRYDAFGRLITSFGMSNRVLAALFTAGYEVITIDRDANSRAPTDVFVPDWDGVEQRFCYRQRQRECLQAIADNPCGVINAPTGFGKMVLIAMTCLLFPKARIDVCTRRVTLVNKLNSFLTRYMPNVGQVGGGLNETGRVTIYTAASLHHADKDADIVLCDEGHELLADDSSRELAGYHKARMYCFSASPTGRLDGTDIRMESLFGWSIFHLSYAEAVSLGLVVPLRVEWSHVRLTANPCAGLDGVYRKRRGIWKNKPRNEIIAKTALNFSPDEQVVIHVETIEHAVHLWQYLKQHGYVLVYNEMEEGDLIDYKNAGLLPEDFPEMTPKLKEFYREEAEAGRLLKVISTMWDVGIDLCQLVAFIRADGADSAIDDIQAPGRASRLHADGDKQVGVVCDFLDEFDSNFSRRAHHRSQRYAVSGWEQLEILPDGNMRPLVTHRG